MARGIKLSDSISISELMHMREVEGLSNGEIAKKLDVHVSTIRGLIGAHPDGKRAKRKNKQLPPLVEASVPDMPRESFKERCERLMAQADEKTAQETPSTHACKGLNPTRTVKEVEERMRLAYEEKADMMAERKADTEADKAREAHCKALDTAAQLSNGIVPVIVHGTVYDVPRVAYEVIKEEVLKNNAQEHEPLPVDRADKGDELHALVEELKVMFSPLSVLDYLKCKLYELGTPHIIYADREAYLTEIYRLLAMQEGVAQHD